MAKSSLARLQSWYVAQCNGDWEHQYGIKIETTDNPGWFVEIDLENTPIAERTFDPIERISESDHNWYSCRVEGGHFMAYCGPLLLDDVISIFLDWSS